VVSLLVVLTLEGELLSTEVYKNRFSTTKSMDDTARSPNTSIKLDTRSKQQFLIDLAL